MSKTKAVKVNLSTKTTDVIATMREEQPKSWYYFMKTFGGKRKYMKVEDAMVWRQMLIAAADYCYMNDDEIYFKP